MKIVSIIITFLLLGTHTFSQQFTATASATQIGVQDVVQIDYKVENASTAEDYKEPVFTDWRVVSGPNYSEQRSYLNNSFSIAITYSYILAPIKKGSLKVPSAKVRINHKNYQSKPLTITVKDGKLLNGTPSASSLPSLFDEFQEPEINNNDMLLSAKDNPATIVKNNVFVKAELSKKTAYVGEPVLLTYKLYTALKSESKVIRQPAFNGFTVTEMTTDDLPDYEAIKGKAYKAFIIRKVQLFPLQAGKLSLDAASVENVFKYYLKEDGLLHEYKSVIENEPLSINVIPLPLAPPGIRFSGGIGDFDIETTVDKTKTEANSTNYLRVKIVGQGSFQNIQAPEIVLPKQAESFELKQINNLDKLTFPVSGHIVFELPFVIKTTGNYTVPPVSFTYFNTRLNSYETIQTKPLLLEITKANANKLNLTDNSSVPNNYKYLWIAPAICLVAGFIWALNTKKTKQTKHEPVKETEQETIAPEQPFFYANDIQFDLKMLHSLQSTPVLVNQVKTILERALQNLYKTRSMNMQEMMQQLQQTNADVYAAADKLLQDGNHILYSGTASEADKEMLYEETVAVVKTISALG